ncbi:zinc-binding alcohol dehydrogenase family protein [Nitrospirillum amazonense]|uniref:Zinc-type alcohol dehydrogenase-like protein n=1 Tax=Nitrospirillum amazonense TaxID=28077 RepID=A0A560F160_9PROT|nr:zinc-binding alcohol dehydrogenase family protein [Nitrospirillum amazonense]TWB15344.1 zinc-binding alcohol dehydrogenase family protein [Nitrospirillum amazonense]
MKAVGYYQNQAIDQADSLVDLELPTPVATGRDLLVRVEAISVNPVDTKVRRNAAPVEGAARILGWDAVGTVVATGPEVTLFKAGDAVYYAGALERPGTNAEFHLVDERLVGPKPASLTTAEAAALPLTSITAWEMLFDRMGVARLPAGAGNDGTAGVLLIVGGAGGVGSIATQLARQLTALTVIATASRPETRAWSLAMGAHHVIDHRQPLEPQVRAIAPGGATHVMSLTATEQHFPAIAALMAPQGKLALIDDPAQPVDITLLKRKSISLHWEFMYTRSMFQTPDMIAQHELLGEVSRLVDAGVLRTTMTQDLGPINAANLRRAHAVVESGTVRGKLVLSGF